MKSGQSMLEFFKKGGLDADMKSEETDEMTEQKVQIMNQITDGVDGASMNVSVDARLGFNLADMLAEDAKAVPHYILKGSSAKVQLQVFDGLAKSLMKMFKGD